MRISEVAVRNYRCLQELTVGLDPYTALTGANGSGKSALLYALQWFFSGGPLEGTDMHGTRQSTRTAADQPVSAVQTISVTVTFVDLSAADRRRLKEYGRGDSARFRRSWTVGDAKDKVVGNAKQAPGFAALRGMTKVGDYRPAYIALRGTHPDLPDLGTSAQKDPILEALATWESMPAHLPLLEDITDHDANHMFGINGPNVIRDCVRLVLVPASVDIAGEIGGAGKGSALGELIGTLMTNAGAVARSAWLQDNQKSIDELRQAIEDTVKETTSIQAKRVNERLRVLVPNASVAFIPTVPDWTPRTDPSVSTDVVIDGLANDLSRQGHGVQRAVMIAMFQSLVPDRESTEATHEDIEGESRSEAEERLREAIDEVPTLVVCIEEPEIYQHPVRARAFGRVLSDLAAQGSAQVLVATHSPYFVRPDQFSSLRCFRLARSVTEVRRTDIVKVAARASCVPDKVQKTVNRRLPTTFSEGFFAEAVVLVEGATDKAVVESLAERLHLALDLLGVSVLEMSGKEDIAIPHAIFEELEIPVYTIVDGDALKAERRHPGDPEGQAKSEASCRMSTQRVIGIMPAAEVLSGSLPYNFGDPTVITKRFTVWHDDIEAELAAWPSFQTALKLHSGQVGREKDALAYRHAVLEAEMTDLPASLRQCVEAVANLKKL